MPPVVVVARLDRLFRSVAAPKLYPQKPVSA